MQQAFLRVISLIGIAQAIRSIGDSSFGRLNETVYDINFSDRQYDL